MTNKLIKTGEGLFSTINQEYIDGEFVDVETIHVDLSAHMSTKILTRNLDTCYGVPGQVLMINEYGVVEWKSLPDMDKELRERYSELEVSWQRVMEAFAEYELVKKLVDDYD